MAPPAFPVPEVFRRLNQPLDPLPPPDAPGLRHDGAWEEAEHRRMLARAIKELPALYLRLDATNGSITGRLTLDPGAADTNLDLFNDTNEWTLQNASADGHFRVIDGSTNVLTLEAGAPASAFYVDSAGLIGLGTATPIRGLELAGASTAGQILFSGTGGGGGEGLQYEDAGGDARYALNFPGSDVVAISNRAANGVVQIRANTSSAGSGGEVTTVTVEDDKVTFAVQLELGAGGPTINVGSGTPESAVTADVGSTFHRTDGGAGTSFYVKETGTGNTGWVGK